MNSNDNVVRQCIETKVPQYLLENMHISTAYMSVRSRLSGIDSQQNSQKKHFDMFDAALSKHQPVSGFLFDGLNCLRT